MNRSTRRTPLPAFARNALPLPHPSWLHSRTAGQSAHQAAIRPEEFWARLGL